MKNILVTGGAGFVGSQLISEIEKNKKIKKIISLDNYSSGTKKNHIKSKKVIYINNETQNINKIKRLKYFKVDTIFHFGEFSRIYPSFKYFDKCWRYNSHGTFEVIKYCLKKNSKLIYSASSAATEKINNLSPYASTKYSNQQLIKNYSKWFGLNYVLVYFYNVYGANQIRSGTMSTVIGIFENQYLTNKPLTVVLPGTQKRDFTHVKDIVTGTIRAAEVAKNDEFHLRSGKSYKIVDIAKLFNKKIKFTQSRPGERFESAKNNDTKAKKVLNFKPKYKLIDYIEKFKNKFPK